MTLITDKINAIFKLMSNHDCDIIDQTDSLKTTSFVKGASVGLLTVHYGGDIINRPYPIKFSFRINNKSFTQESSIDEINSII